MPALRSSPCARAAALFVAGLVLAPGEEARAEDAPRDRGPTAASSAPGTGRAPEPGAPPDARTEPPAAEGGGPAGRADAGSTTPQAAPPSLAGRWAMRQVLSAKVEVPFVGDAFSDAHAVLLLDLEQEGDVVEGSTLMCRLSLHAEPDLVRPVLPDAFRQAVGRGPFKGRVVAEKGGRYRLVNDRQTAVLGVRLADPATEKMPESAEDPRVIDTDHDGKPGMTMLVEGLFDIEIYLAQRQWTQIDGHVVGGDRVEGRVAHGAEQLLLGADSILVQALPDMEPVPARSRFEMVRLPPGAGCPQATLAFAPAAAGGATRVGRAGPAASTVQAAAVP